MSSDNSLEHIWGKLQDLFKAMDVLDDATALNAKVAATQFMREHGLSFRKLMEQIKERGVLLPSDVDTTIQMMDPTTSSDADIAMSNAALGGARSVLRKCRLTFERIINAYIEFERLHHKLTSMQQLHRENQIAVDELRDEHKATVDGLHRDHRGVLDAIGQLRAKYQAVVNGHRVALDAIERLRANHQAAIDRLRQDHQTAIDDLRHDLRTAANDLQAVGMKAQQLAVGLADVDQRANIFIVVGAALSALVLAVVIIASRSNIIVAVLWSTLIAAGVTVPQLDKDGKPVIGEDGSPVVKAKYTGMHALRHFYASWCINRRVDGGLELPAKMVQERLRHANIAMTFDTYGHLFPRGDDGRELAEAELRLIG
jgi:hypothetical protein